MVVRRNDARRRRLVVDPAAPLGDAAGCEAPSPNPPKRKKKTKPAEARAYSYGADRRNQLKTTDLIPKRFLSCAIVLMVLLSALWLINFAAANAVQWQSQIGAGGVEALAIRGQGSLASWFSSFLLIMTGLASVQIYALRQHRCDDYRGTYRLWLWMAGLFLIASISCVIDVASIGSNLLQWVTQDSAGQQAWVLVVIKLVGLAILVARGIYEMRESRGSLALIVFVWGAYSAAALMQLPLAQQATVSLGSEMVTGNCLLFGTVALLQAHLTYARFVYLRAHGLIKLRTAKSKRIAESGTAKKSAQAKQEGEKAKATGTRAKKTGNAVTKDKKTKPQSQRKSKPAAKQQSKPAPPVETKGGRDDRQTEKSPQEVLREMAAASRAKAKKPSNQQKMAHDEQDEESHGVIKMSKSQRRKQRKLEKQRRRAA